MKQGIALYVPNKALLQPGLKPPTLFHAALDSLRGQSDICELKKKIRQNSSSLYVSFTQSDTA